MSVTGLASPSDSTFPTGENLMNLAQVVQFTKLNSFRSSQIDRITNFGESELPVKSGVFLQREPPALGVSILVSD